MKLRKDTKLLRLPVRKCITSKVSTTPSWRLTWSSTGNVSFNKGMMDWNNWNSLFCIRKVGKDPFLVSKHHFLINKSLKISSSFQRLTNAAAFCPPSEAFETMTLVWNLTRENKTIHRAKKSLRRFTHHHFQSLFDIEPLFSVNCAATSRENIQKQAKTIEGKCKRCRRTRRPN